MGRAAQGLADPVTFTGLDFRSTWDRMRGEDHLEWTQVDERRGFWSVVRYADVDKVLRDPHTFTSERGTLMNILGVEDPAGGRQIAATDPPRHTLMRARLQKALAIRSIERQEALITGLVREVLEPLADGGPFDFAAAMLALPVAVGGEAMALPRADWPWLGRLLNSSIAADDPAYQIDGDTQATLDSAHRELFAYFQDIYVERRRRLGDDLISVLISTEFEGRTMSPGEVMSNCYSVLLGAVVTTPHSPNYLMTERIGDGTLDRWAADLTVTPTAVEEALRLASPVSHFMRYAVADAEVGGTQIEAGQAVVNWLGAANRDPSVFVNPETFDLRRRPNKHLAFGIGPHYCVGHTVARVTLRILFTELFSRFTDFAPAGEPERLVSTFISGYRRLPITARPRNNNHRVSTLGAPLRPAARPSRNRWLPSPPSPSARGRIFLIPYSGCGASLYRRWPRSHEGVDLLPVELPGHETRFAEPNFTSYAALAADLVVGLDAQLDVPFGFFGHCGAALAAYETTAELVRTGRPRAAGVFVSSQVAPQDGPAGRYLSMSDAELAVELESLITESGGRPSPEMIELYLEVLRADVETNKRYVMAKPNRLSTPITAIGWSLDDEIPPATMTGWSACGDTTTVLLEGRHRRFVESPTELLDVLVAGLGLGPRQN